MSAYSTSYCPPELADCNNYTSGTGGFRNIECLYELGAKIAPTNIWAEFGVGQGRSAGRLQKLLDRQGQFFLFDSWKGLPEPWCMGDHFTEPIGRFECPKPQIPDKRLQLVEGWFEDTLPFQFPGQLGLIHIDCDIYSSTQTVLAGVDPWVGTGTVIIFDELFGYQHYADHEYRAMREWLKQTGKEIIWMGKERFAAIGVILTPA